MTAFGAMLVLFMLITVFKASASSAISINVTSLHVRSGPSTNYRIITAVRGGARYGVLESRNGWYRISLGKTAGWVSGKYVKVTPSYSSLKGTSITPINGSLVIKYSALNVRSGPSSRCSKIGTAYRGRSYTVTGKSGSWYRINFNSKTGWVDGRYQTYKAPSRTSVPASGTTLPQSVTVNCSTLNVRASSTTASSIITTIKRGEVYSVAGSARGWYRIAVRGRYGWVSAAYVIANYKSQSVQQPDYTGRYVEITSPVSLYLIAGGSQDQRTAVVGKTFKVLEHKGDWYRIRFGSREGWIPSSSAKLLDAPPSGRISLGWNYIYDRSRNAYYDSYIGKSSVQQGMDVISPTWFYVSSTNGSTDPATLYVLEKGSRDYVDKAHNNGYEVWALFTENDKYRFNAMFKDSSARSRIISQVVQYARDYDLDGINIDFEALGAVNSDTAGTENRDGLTYFVRDLSAELKKYNITVSIDVVKSPGSDLWSNFYDRSRLKDFVDFMILMGYDEHVGAYSPGPVGSIPWVEGGIQNLISVYGVPEEKIILGVPFYTRDWIERFSGDTAVRDTESLSMSEASNRINASGNAVITYDSQAGSQKAVFTDPDGTRHTIWIENQVSMAARMDLVKKYNLRGAAAWKIGQETQDIWGLIMSRLK
jgi:spore germination protein YaaH/uncharacterized protein YgiM (DUF1202 family)